MLLLPLALLLLAAPSRAGESAPVAEGIALFRARRPAEASVVLHRAAAEEADPASRSRARYYLARSLHDLGLVTSAERELYALAEAGPEDPCFLHALPGLLDIARQTGDESTLRAVAPRYLEVDLPPAVAAEVRLQQGLAAWRAGQRRQAADLLEGIPESTPAFARAAYVRGLALEKNTNAPPWSRSSVPRRRPAWTGQGIGIWSPSPACGSPRSTIRSFASTRPSTMPAWWPAAAPHGRRP